MRSRTANLRPAAFRAVLISIVLGLCAAAGAQDKPAPPAPPSPERMDAAIRRGLDYLYSLRREDGTWPSPHAARHSGGIEALVTYTALRAGDAPDRPELAGTIRALDELLPQTVYARSARALLYARLGGKRRAEIRAADARWLSRVQKRPGGWGYGPGHPVTRQRRNWLDNSNTQLAVLALHEAGVPGREVWPRAQAYWARAQNDDGGWGYTPADSRLPLKATSYGSMTAAGVATSLLLSWHSTEEGAGADAWKRMQRGVEWLAAHDALPEPGKDKLLSENPKWLWGDRNNWAPYYLWALTRAADAAGLRMLGERDWYVDLTRLLLRTQHEDGAWRSAGDEEQPAVASTCFALLALANARRGVLINKMAIPEGDPAAVPHPRDAAALVEWFRRETGHAVTWQRVSTTSPARVLREAPLLYLAPAGGVSLPEPLGPTLVDYVRRGGTVIVAPAAGDDAAVEQARDYFTALLPDYRAEPLPAEHPVFRIVQEIPAEARPEVLGIGDYCRMRIFVFPPGLADTWDAGWAAGDGAAFHLIGNVVRYATNGYKPRPRRAQPEPEAEAPTTSTVRVARVRHLGDWKTNPLAIPRLHEVLARAVSVGVEEAEPGSPAAVWWLTGSVDPKLRTDQLTMLREYVEGGGTLLVDSASGREAFFEAVKASLEEAFGAGSLRPIKPAHPLVTGEFAGGMGSDVRRVRYSASAAADRGAAEGPPALYGVEHAGRLVVVLSRYGLACPMEGCAAYGCAGLKPEDAQRVVANVLLYAMTHGAWPER